MLDTTLLPNNGLHKLARMQRNTTIDQTYAKLNRNYNKRSETLVFSLEKKNLLIADIKENLWLKQIRLLLKWSAEL